MALFGLDQLLRNSRGEVFAAASVGDRKQSANCSARPLRHHLQRAHVFTQPGSVSAGWHRQRLIILVHFRVEYVQAAAASRRGLVLAFVHCRVPTSVRRMRRTAAKAKLLTPCSCNSRLRLKERRNSSTSGPHLRQTGGFFVPMLLRAQTDAMPASGGRLIQHPQGEYARRLVAVSNLPTSRPSSCRGRVLLWN
jgi:hypothetical protein